MTSPAAAVLLPKADFLARIAGLNRPKRWLLDRSTSGILAPGSWFRLRIGAWMVGLFTFAVLVMFASFQLPDWLGLSQSASYPVAISTPLAGLVLYALAVRISERRPAGELSLRDAPANLLFGAAVGFAFMILALGLLWLLGLNTVVLGRWHSWFHYLIFNAYVSAVVEELAFRAILLRLLVRLTGPIPGLLISALLFAAVHASHAPPVAVALLIIDGGLLLGVLYLATGSLWAPIGAHMAYDFAEWSLFGINNKDGYLVITPAHNFPDWLTGGSSGPDGSVFSVPIAAVLIICTIMWGFRGSHRDDGLWADLCSTPEETNNGQSKDVW